MRIKVAGTHYEIIREKGLMAEDDVYGNVKYVTAKIRLDSELPPERMQQVLIHELLHAVFYEAGFREHEEDVVNRVANVLHQVLADNDVLALMEEIVEKEAV